MNICLDLFGQLRFWDLQTSIRPFVHLFEMHDHNVITLGTFWNDDYTRKNLEDGKLDIFDNVQLIEEPDLDTYNLEKYFYALEKTSDQRSNFEKRLGTEFDLIISARPDINFTVKDYRKITYFFAEVETSSNPTFWTFKDHVHDSTAGIRIEDKLFFSNNPAASLICSTFSRWKGDIEFPIKELTYHTSLYSVVKCYGIDFKDNIEFVLPFLYRHKLEREWHIKKENNLEVLNAGKSTQTIEELYECYKPYLFTRNP